MKEKGLVTKISRTDFVQRQSKIKIHHIAYQDLLKHSSFKFFEIQTQEINDSEFYRKNH